VIRSASPSPRQPARAGGAGGLHSRALDTLVAAWEADAAGAEGASVQLLPGAVAAVFPAEPERTFFNNALLGKSLARAEHRNAVDAVEAAYLGAGVTSFAAWVHERDRATAANLERRGYTLDTTTRLLGLRLDGIRLPRPAIELGPSTWAEHLRAGGLPPDLLRHLDPDAYRILVARLDGESVATAIAFDHAGDCGIFNVGTPEHARRRGLATALTTLHLQDARERGCETASLQSTPMAERVYATVGFRDLGRILEYAPAVGRPTSR
jgi:ribosomal protein S18 acetylase RimI-like enzyme